MKAGGDTQWLEPLAAGKSALSRAVRLGIGPQTALEVYVEFGRTSTVKVFDGRVESIVTAEPRGLGIRAIDDGRVGYSYTADLTLTGIDKAMIESVDNALAAGVDQFQALPGGVAVYADLPDLWHPGVGSTPIDHKVSIALAAEAAALAEPEVGTVEACEYSDAESRVAIVSSQGVEAESEQSFCFAYAFALAGADADRQSGLGFTMGRHPDELEPEHAGKEAAAKARALVGASPCSTGVYTVVFDRETAAALMGLVASSLSADAVQKGRSVFRGRIGEQVGSTVVTILDDGLAAGGPATGPFDAEGVPQQTTPLIESGILRSVLFDSYTARKEGANTHSTGNSTRQSYRMLPSVGLSNLVVRSGRGTAADLMRRVGSGLYVENVSGLHSGVNPVTGEISVGVTGRLIEAGEPVIPVREVTIATDFITLLKSVSDVADDARWIPFYGSVSSPSIAVTEIAVSGK